MDMDINAVHIFQGLYNWSYLLLPFSVLLIFNFDDAPTERAKALPIRTAVCHYSDDRP